MGYEGFACFSCAICRAVVLAKGSAVSLSAGEDAGFSGDELDDLPDGHAAGKAVRVHDKVGANASIGIRHVLLGDDGTTDA